MRSGRLSPLSVQLFIVDILLNPIGLFIATYLRTTLPFGRSGNLPPDLTTLPWPVYLIAIFSWSIALVLNDAYDPERVLRWFNEAGRVLWSSIVATVLMAGLIYMTFREVSRLQFIYFFLVNLGLLLSYRALLRIYFRLVGRTRPGVHNRILILGAGDLGTRISQVIRDHSRWGYNLVGFLDDDANKQGKSYDGAQVLGTILEVKSMVEQKRVEEVWVALPVWALDRINLVLSELEKLPVRVKIIPDYFSLALVRANAEVLGGIPIIGLREPVIVGPARWVKRMFDLVVSTLLLIISFPALIIVTLLIRLDSPGKILFIQNRIGENGRIFGMFKFRTMVFDAEQRQAEVIQETDAGEVIHKHEDDPRVTRVGRFLRRYSLDELPQLFNVLKGDMSLVGPRPEMPWLVDRYDSWQRKRFAVPQGITGWWQINGRSDKPMHLNTEDDLYYVYNYSLWLDIQILLRTPWAALQGRGAF
ncbi:MAG: sugar transferase [Anaerolineales bacterium]|nr:MAG: sugar transferase [Anaerolineales bacterium]